MKLVLAKIGTHQTVQFAVEELARCLKTMDGKLRIEKRTYQSYEETLEGVLWIGLSDKVVESEDDEILLDVCGGSGVISASNERAVLIAAYRFLYELGCRWIRPGATGEILVNRSLSADALTVHVQERASYRHRSVCIEGTNEYEHVVDLIDWLPKVGMSGYQVQFMVPYCFFQKKYMNFSTDPAKLSRDDVSHIWKNIEEEIEKRSLHYHAVGHGWTCEPFGIDGVSWQPEEDEVLPEIKQFFAQVNGKRELFGGIPLNTNLCYSNPAVRDKMTNAVVDYCREHPNVKYLHFWLADLDNNQCECDQCKKMRPSDYYVLMLNELDKKLTDAEMNTKVVFLVYFDLLWEPEYCRFENPDRFVLMFAPISRSYSMSYADIDTSTEVELPPYVRNKTERPTRVEVNVGFLRKWQEQFSGDSFVFDYHLMWDHVFEPGYYDCAKILHKDMANLDKIGLNGMVSCQVQKTSFPNGLPMYVMAKALWDKTSNFDQVAQEYFAAAFGNCGEKVRTYFATLSQLFHPAYVRGELPLKNEEVAEDLEKIDRVVDEFTAYCSATKNTEGSLPGEQDSWKYVQLYGDYCKHLANLLRHRACGNWGGDEERLQKIRDYLDEIQEETFDVMDVQNYWHAISTYMHGEARALQVQS